MIQSFFKNHKLLPCKHLNQHKLIHTTKIVLHIFPRDLPERLHATHKATATEMRTVARQEKARKERTWDTGAAESSGELPRSPTSDLVPWGSSPEREDLVRAR